jgi:hypothetical protein
VEAVQNTSTAALRVAQGDKYGTRNPDPRGIIGWLLSGRNEYRKLALQVGVVSKLIE